MKFGQHLRENIAPEYGSDPYLDYEALDKVIRDLSEQKHASANLHDRQVSLTTPPPTDARGLAQDNQAVTDEVFLKAIESELQKVETFTLREVTSLRQELERLEKESTSGTPKISNNNNNNKKNDGSDENAAAANNDDDNQDNESSASLSSQADKVAESFLRLEKYVNINFMGFHKILKKHDKHVPANPCKAFYIARMHAQAWVRGDYSDLVVRLSNVYAAIRNDHEKAPPPPEDGGQQSFLRSTTKYWVKTEDVSRVKYAVLTHLPVFLQKTSTGESDSQMTNSVYLDNDQLELYHGRLDKSPGAIALRLRWYGAGSPQTVFVERKTHREKWTGQVSVKERFMIDESEVQQVMTNSYPVAEKKRQMVEDQNKSAQESDEWETLVNEITQVVSSKQLVPTMRTQYMRTAFQIPFDATVRVSLDTNLCMISERGYDLQNMTAWHRDPSEILAPEEITRFPHAVLEIKLELKGDSVAPPQWVTDLQNSGMLYEVHKFSKFMHGCAVLLPEDVQSVPYWVDDVSLRESIIASGGQRILVDESRDVGPGSNEMYPHLLPFGNRQDDRQAVATGRTSNSVLASRGQTRVTAADFYHDADQDDEEEMMDGMNNSWLCCNQQSSNTGYDNDDETVGWCFPFCSRQHYNEAVMAPTSVQKIEPKVFFANERTFLSWMRYSILLASVASGLLAFSDEGEQLAHVYAFCLLGVALLFCGYALRIFLWRSDKIKTRIPGRWDDPSGPLLLGSVLLVVLTGNFVLKLYELILHFRHGGSSTDDGHHGGNGTVAEL